MSRSRSIVVVIVVLGALLLPTVDAFPATSTTTASVTHVVQPGDNLFGIAQRYGIALGDLLKANQLRLSTVIQPGQKLMVPGVVLPTKLPPRLPEEIRSLSARLRLLPVFQAEAARNKVPADLLMALAYTESVWRANAVSPAGAVGIGQLMPDTSAWLASDLIGARLDPRVPEDNIRMSARFLRYLLDRYPTNLRLALAAYFEGTRTVAKAGPSRGAQRYARIVIQRRSLFTF